MKLRECPFCGGDAEEIEVTETDNYGGHVIQCKHCLASTRVFFGEHVGLYEAWNHRPSPEGVERLVDKLIGSLLVQSACPFSDHQLDIVRDKAKQALARQGGREVMSDVMLKGIMEALGYIESAIRELNGTLMAVEESLKALEMWTDQVDIKRIMGEFHLPTYCTCNGQGWLPRELDENGDSHEYCEDCGKEKKPDTGMDELVERYVGNLNACFMEGFLRPNTLDKFRDILRSFAEEVKRG